LTPKEGHITNDFFKLLKKQVDTEFSTIAIDICVISKKKYYLDR